ncbi:MAG: 4'-phosphopantetheinyl transferase superfamily protein [Gammaproteobacteria bacterium]|jgi:4'-phosphopantetheinyl transferase
MTFTTVQTGIRFPFLPIPDHDFNLDTQRIDLWQYPLEALWAGAESLLNTDELQRAHRYHFERHRRRFTLARALLRLILARYLNVAPHDLDFATNDYGKPYLNHSSQIQFNLSHSRDLALLAIGQHYPLGVDLEFFSSRPFQGISNMMFSPQEIQDYAHMQPSMRSLTFFHVWAQKEAFIKACGMGLSYPTKTFDVPVGSPENSNIVDNRHAASWHMRSFMPKIACYAAVCHHPTIQTVRFRVLSKDAHVIR